MTEIETPPSLIDMNAVRLHIRETYGFAEPKVEKIIAAAQRTLQKDFAHGFQALSDRDITALSKAAHSIKGSLASLGLPTLAEDARRIEKQEIDEAGDRLDVLSQAFHALHQTVNPLLA